MVTNLLLGWKLSAARVPTTDAPIRKPAETRQLADSQAVAFYSCKPDIFAATYEAVEVGSAA